MSWFGIRGIGSLFYLAYAMNHGLAPDMAATMVALVWLASHVAQGWLMELLRGRSLSS